MSCKNVGCEKWDFKAETFCSEKCRKERAAFDKSYSNPEKCGADNCGYNADCKSNFIHCPFDGKLTKQKRKLGG